MNVNNKNVVAIIALVISLFFIIIATQESKLSQLKLATNLLAEREINKKNKIAEILFQPSHSTKFSQSGRAIFSEQNGQLTLILDLSTSAFIRNPQPAYIRSGSCLNTKAVLYSLTDVIAGLSETDLDISLDQLKFKRPLSIDIRKSYDESQIKTACANL